MSTSELGYSLAAIVLFAFVALCVVAAAYDALTRRPTVRPESHSERNHRLDAEARIAANLAARWQG